MFSFNLPKEQQELFLTQFVQNGAEYQKALKVAEMLAFRQVEDFAECGKQFAEDFSEGSGVRDRECIL